MPPHSTAVQKPATITSRSGLDDLRMGDCFYNTDRIGSSPNDKAGPNSMGLLNGSCIPDHKLLQNNVPLGSVSSSSSSSIISSSSSNMAPGRNVAGNKSPGASGDGNSTFQGVENMFPLNGEQLSEVIFECRDKSPGLSSSEIARCSPTSLVLGLPQDDAVAQPISTSNQFPNTCQSLTPPPVLPPECPLTPAPSPQPMQSQSVSPCTAYNGSTPSPALLAQPTVSPSAAQLPTPSPQSDQYLLAQVSPVLHQAASQDSQSLADNKPCLSSPVNNQFNSSAETPRQSPRHSQYNSPSTMQGSPNDLSPVPYKSPQAVSPASSPYSSVQMNGKTTTSNPNLKYSHPSPFSPGTPHPACSTTNIPTLHNNLHNKSDCCSADTMPSNGTSLFSQPGYRPNNNDYFVSNYKHSNSNEPLNPFKPTQLDGSHSMPYPLSSRGLPAHNPSTIPETRGPDATRVSTCWNFFPVAPMPNAMVTATNTQMQVPAPLCSPSLPPPYRKPQHTTLSSTYLEQPPALGLSHPNRAPGTGQPDCHLPFFRPLVSKSECPLPPPTYPSRTSFGMPPRPSPLPTPLRTDLSDPFPSPLPFSPLPCRSPAMGPLSPNGLNGSFLGRPSLPLTHLQRKPMLGKQFQHGYSGGSPQTLGYPLGDRMPHPLTPQPSLPVGGHFPFDSVPASPSGRPGQPLLDLPFADDELLQRALQNITDFSSNM